MKMIFLQVFVRLAKEQEALEEEEQSKERNIAERLLDSLTSRKDDETVV